MSQRSQGSVNPCFFLLIINNEFVEIWPAQQRVAEDWYKGTGDAVYQNLDIIRNIDKPKDDGSAHGTMVVGGSDEGFSSPNIEDMMVIQHGDEQELAHDELEQPNIDEPEMHMDHGDEETDESFANSASRSLDNSMTYLLPEKQQAQHGSWNKFGGIANL